MSDLHLLEDHVSDRLHAHGLPTAIPDLGRRSVRLGRQIRRRRRTGVTALLTAALAVVLVLGTSMARHDGSQPAPPAASLPPSQHRGAPSPTGVLTDPGALLSGDAPRVDYVADGSWHRADGSTLPLRRADRGDGALSWVHSGSHLFVGRVGEYSIDGGPARKMWGQTDRLVPVNGVPGPNGSVLVESDVLSIYGRVGRWRRNDDYGSYRGKLTTPRPARTAVWSVDEQGVLSDDAAVVVRRSSLRTDASTTKVPGWESITTSDPTSDQVVLRDGASLYDVSACNAIVNGTTGRTRWHSCTWTFLRLSSDGRFVLARGKAGLAVLDITGRGVVYRLGTNDDVADESYRFAADDTLTAVVRNPDDFTEAIASCDIGGSCWRSTPWTNDFHYTLVTGDR